MASIDATLKAPFPAFGGKSRAAAECWRRFGGVVNYVEPFCNSCAVLLGRPQPFSGSETVNDLNAWLSNVWRALRFAPKAAARFCDWPVSELDLHSRGDAIFYRLPELYQLCEATGYASRCRFAGACPCKAGTPQTWIEWQRADCTHFCAAGGGVWMWGACAWIGDNWSYSAHSAKRNDDGQPVATTRAKPHLSRGQGVNRQLPHLSRGQGVNRQRPHLSRGRGVNRQLPHLGDGGRGVNRRGVVIRAYFRALAARLRDVRVCCGDWRRVLSQCPTTHLGLTAVFLDPPYGVTDRDNVYGDEESFTVAGDVRAWCLDHGADPLLRIALCGYQGEHEALEAAGWAVWVWKTGGGYGCQAAAGNENCRRERIWFSPGCVRPAEERTLFLLGAG